MRKGITLALIALLLLISALLCARIISYYSEETEQRAEFEALRQIVISPVSESSSSEAEVDINALRDLNSECVSWITIPGTTIDYPVMQSIENPEYYLHHNFSLQRSSHGVPFLDYRCSFDRGHQLIIYGHNLHDGSMFSPLHQYKDSSFLAEHPVIELYTLQGKYEYSVLWALEMSSEYNEAEWSLFKSASLETKEGFEEAVTELSKRSLLPAAEIDTNTEGQLLSLVTCEESDNDKRFVVVAYRTSE